MAKLYFYYSTMNAGKSTTLLQSSFNYRERGMDTLLLTAAFDDRYSQGTVTSRIGLAQDAELFKEGDDLFARIGARHANSPIHCVLVDEAQFLSKEQVWQLSEVCDQLRIPVLCYGIRTDFQGQLFSGSQWLLAWGDELQELFEAFAHMVEALRSAQADEVAALDAAIADAKSGGLSDEALAGIVAVRDRMQATLD